MALTASACSSDDGPQITGYVLTTDGDTLGTSSGGSDDSEGSTSSLQTGGSEESSASAADSTGADPTTGAVSPWSCGDLPIVAQPHGRAYVDTNNSDLGRYSGGFESSIDMPTPGVQVSLLGSTEAPVQTCDDGGYQFQADDGVYVAVPPPHPTHCSQRNCSARFSEALTEGSVNIVTLGDSVPTFGGVPPFPSRVATLVEAVNGATVTNVNLASFEARSVSWLPGGQLFEASRPALTDADVVVVSLGATDLRDFAENIDLSDLGAVPAAVDTLVDTLVSNVLAITAEVRAHNPTTDIVFCLYPDYSAATQTTPWNALTLIPAGIIAELFGGVRSRIAPADGLIVVDLLGVTDQLPFPLDDALADGIHFNEVGHDLYAHQVFRALGGVIVGASPLANEPASTNRQDFGYVP